MVYRKGDKEMQIDMTNRQLIRNIRENSTYKQILMVTIEELSELIQVLSKELRIQYHDETLRINRADNDFKIIEELADVYLMLEQLQQICVILDIELNQIINKKCLRTLEKNTHTKINSDTNINVRSN